MRVLIGCEFSGIVRRAFAALGHDAWSCDLLPSEDRSNRHITGDVRDILNDGWDLLAVFHPPCTRLCNSGIRWLTEPPTKLSDSYPDEIAREYLTWDRDCRLAYMWQSLDEGAEFFSTLWNAKIKRVCVENPKMHRHAKERIVNYQDPQIVQPWWFGDRKFKGIGLHLRGLPPLLATNKLTPPVLGTPEHKEWSEVANAVPHKDRWKLRSRFFPGAASAMAEQWGGDATDEQIDIFKQGVVKWSNEYALSSRTDRSTS